MGGVERLFIIIMINYYGLLYVILTVHVIFISSYPPFLLMDMNLDDRLSVQTAGRQLSISHISVDDTGSYTCRAINKAGQAKLTH